MPTPSTIADLYTNAHDPKEGDSLPLHGATLGCVAGSSGSSTANSLGLGRWSGKDFGSRDSSTGLYPVSNIVDNNVAVGSSIVNAGTWADGLPVENQFPGHIGVDTAWSDNSRKAWVLNYNAEQTGAGVLNGLIANTRDEIRKVSEGLMVGKTYAKPLSSANPLPWPVDEGAMFLLFQVCDAEGNYPSSPTDRVLS